MRTLVILNPVAGRHAALRILQRIHTEVPEARDWESAVTRGRGHATELARAAVAPDARYTQVVAIGGDGTVCEVANGLALSQVPLAIVPTGTANDVARNLGIPRDPLAAARLAANTLPRAIDLGEVHIGQSVRYFVNVGGFGFDAEAARRTNRLPKVVGGTLPYLVGAVQTLWQYASPAMRVTIDDEVIEARLFMVAVGNCSSYAGGMRIVPPARPDDGAFDVCLVHHLSRLEVLRLIPRLYTGRHVRHPAVRLFRCRTLEGSVVSAATDAPSARVACHVDGEPVGDLPVRFAIRPGALRCVTGPAPGLAS